MNLSSPSTPKPDSKRRILILGPPGGRKTTTIMSFPNIAFFDIDGNLDGPKQALKKLTGTEPSFGYESVSYNKAGQLLEISEWFDNLVRQMTEFRDEVKKGTSPFQFACVDGLRNLGEMIKANVMKSQRRESMETRDWDPYKTKMLKIVFLLAQEIGVHMLFTCHEQEIWKPSPNPKEMMKDILVGYEPMVQGGIQNAFSGFFTDVWRITSELAGGGQVETKITSVKSTYSPDLKSSIGLPPELIIKSNETAWSKLQPYFQGRI